MSDRDREILSQFKPHFEKINHALDCVLESRIPLIVDMGSHSLLGKQSVFEHSMHVPLIFVGPGIPQGKSTQAFSYLLDVFPTLCDVLGLQPPADHGTSGADAEMQAAWNHTTGDSSVILAIIDTGIDINHPDLQNNLWTNRGETGLDNLVRNKATNKIDDDGNGFIDDVHGWNFLGNPDGRNVDNDNLEVTRVYRLLKLYAKSAAGFPCCSIAARSC